MTRTNPEGRTHARMFTRMHIHLSKLVTAMSRFTASGLDRKKQYSCYYSIVKAKVWLYSIRLMLLAVIISRE